MPTMAHEAARALTDAEVRQFIEEGFVRLDHAMLSLFSDVGEDDAPTRIRRSSHLDVARLLLPAGEAGMSFMELAGKLEVTADRPEALATGEAGTVYLCHPFLAHAAQPHRGSRPRFLAQPPLAPAGPSPLHRAGGDPSPVEIAIRLGQEAR